MRNTAHLILWLFALTNLSNAAPLPSREWQVDGVTRKALVYVPIPDNKKTNAAPVVFAFHGHGGSMQNAARMFHIETLWPEAIVVYMQGLNTPGRLTDPEGKRPGWQRTAGDQSDRDLKFFDAVLASLKKDHTVDVKRIYSTGHSNGGSFTYLLWQTRGEHFAAFAPSASLHRDLLGDIPGVPNRQTEKAAPQAGGSLIPKPILHIAGKNDDLVKYNWQKLFLEMLRKRNECAEGKPWPEDKRCNLYKSKTGGDILTYIHSGTHKYPEEAPEIIVKFFKGQVR
ncbi:MAG: esterase [Verrucomicrobia bacterium]|nr:esterase [Verrucomicrobiota bacterium]